MAKRYRIKGKFVSQREWIKHNFNDLNPENLTDSERKLFNQRIKFLNTTDKLRKSDGTFIQKRQAKYITDFYNNIDMPIETISKQDVRELIDTFEKTVVIKSSDLESRISEFSGTIIVNGKEVSEAEFRELFMKYNRSNKRTAAKENDVNAADVYEVLYRTELNIDKNTFSIDLKNPEGAIISKKKKKGKK